MVLIFGRMSLATGDAREETLAIDIWQQTLLPSNERFTLIHYVLATADCEQ